MLVPGLTARFFGNYRNELTRYYWVQAVLPNGRSSITGPASVTIPAQLNASNFVEISWRAVPGAIAYDVIITTTSSTPSGTLSTGAVILGTSKLSANDTGQYSSWTITPNPAVPSTTDDLAEGATNLYYTAARVQTFLTAVASLNNSIIAAGTVYTLTETQAEAVFGTTSPSVGLNSSQKYLVFARVRIEFVGATTDANRTVTVNIKQVTATGGHVVANLTGLTMVQTTGTITLQTGPSMNLSAFGFYTGVAGDILQVYAAIDTLPTAGSIVIAEAQIYVVSLNA